MTVFLFWVANSVMRSQRDDVVAVSRGIDGSADMRARFQGRRACDGKRSED